MERRLATIRIIDDIIDMPNGKNLGQNSGQNSDPAPGHQLVKIGGWNIVVTIPKNLHTDAEYAVAGYADAGYSPTGTRLNSKFSIGEKCIFLEPDSYIPPGSKLASIFPFMKNMTIKNKNINGVISQGYIIPITKEISEIIYKKDSLVDPMTGAEPRSESESFDVTDILGVIHKDKKSINDHGVFPNIAKTGEPRLQNCVGLIDKLTNGYYFSKKIDGSSATYIIDNGIFTVASHNLIRGIKTDNGYTRINEIYFDIADKYGIENILRKNNYCIQGEIAGKNDYRKNRENLDSLYFFVFNVIDIETNEKLDLDSMIKFCTENNLQTVPILERGLILNKTADELFTIAESHGEGIVVRSLDMKVSFKVISKKYVAEEDKNVSKRK